MLGFTESLNISVSAAIIIQKFDESICIQNRLAPKLKFWRSVWLGPNFNKDSIRIETVFGGNPRRID
jgi:hypothetical protein